MVEKLDIVAECGVSCIAGAIRLSTFSTTLAVKRDSFGVFSRLRRPEGGVALR